MPRISVGINAKLNENTMKKLKRRNMDTALSIPEPESMRRYTGDRRRAAKYAGIIDGEEIVRSSKWWAEFKTLTEKQSASRDLVARRANNKWTDFEATTAYVGETREEMWERLGTSQRDINNNNALNSAYNKFIYGGCSANQMS